MNVKELIFGGTVHSGGADSVYRDSIQAWLPVKNIIGGVVVTKDNRFIKILEVLPVNIYLKSPADRKNIITSFASYLKIAPDAMQLQARTLPADTADYVRQMEEYGNYLKDRTDIFIITAYIDDYMTDLASVMRRRGKNVIFYCNDDSVNDPRILRVGRVNRYYFMND